MTESETAGSEQQTEEAEDSEAESEITDIDADEFDDLVEQAQNQDTYDEESGLELHDVLEQAGDEGVDLDAMEEGEIATFEAVSAYSARSAQQDFCIDMQIIILEPIWQSRTISATEASEQLRIVYSQQNLGQDLEIIQSQRLETIRR